MLENNRYILLAAELRDLAERKTWEKAAQAMQDAAAAIEKLRADKERLIANILNDVVSSELVESYAGSALERADERVEELEAANRRLTKANERLRAVCTAAISDLGAARDCLTCLHDGECGRSGCIGYKWRGVKGAHHADI